MSNKRTDIGIGIEEGLREALAWKRGEVSLEARNIDPMPAERIKLIRKKVAGTVLQFERRFGISAATINNWEQGRRKPDPAARLLLTVIELNPEVVENAFQARQSA